MKSNKQQRRIPKELMEGADYLLQQWAINTSINPGNGYPSSSPEQKERIGGVFDDREPDLDPLDIMTINTMNFMAKDQPERFLCASLEYKKKNYILSKISVNKGWWNPGSTRFYHYEKAGNDSYIHFIREHYNINRSKYYNKLQQAKRDIAHFVLNCA